MQPFDWTKLRESLSAREILVLRGNDEYRNLLADGTNHYSLIGLPLGFVLANNVEDVQEVVKFAASYGGVLPLAVACGRHTQHALSTGSLVIDLRKLNHVSIEDDVVRVGAGCRLGSIDNACRERSVAITAGTCKTVGIGGYVQNSGGGGGWLERKFGRASQQLVAAKVVVADGNLVSCNQSENEDLFSCLGGGRGNFGVVVEFTFKGNRMPNDGGVLFATKKAKEVDSRDLIDYFSCTFNEDDVPDSLTGRLTITASDTVASMCWIGDIASGEAYFRNSATDTKFHNPFETLEVKSYWDTCQKWYSDPEGAFYMSKREVFLVVDSLSSELLDEVLNLRASMPQKDCAILVIAEGGQVHKLQSGSCKHIMRSTRFMIEFYAFTDPGAEGPMDRWMAAAQGVQKKDWSAAGIELRKLKRKFDPSNIFRCNENITPLQTEKGQESKEIN